MTIGERIKELRKKNDITQEKLANYLNISYQAVSKWECGVTMPDLSMIVPLTKLLHTTADELLGITEVPVDERKAYFDAEYEEFWNKEDKEADYQIALQAFTEYPGDFRYLHWLASAEYYTAFDENYRNGGSLDFFHERMEQSIKHYQMLYEDCKDEKLRNSALWGLVLDYKFTNRYEEARKYAELYPEGRENDRDDALALCLQGEELWRLKQKIVEKSFGKFCYALVDMWYYFSSDKSISAAQKMEILDAYETIIHAFFPDGNYFGFNYEMKDICYKRAHFLMEEGDHESAVRALAEAKKCAVELNRVIAEGKIRYTCPILKDYEREYKVLRPADELECWQDVVQSIFFAPLKDREDYKALFE